MIRCICIDCKKRGKFKDLQEARNARWVVWGMHMNENEFYASCSNCDTTVSTDKNPNKIEFIPKPESKLINSSIIAYE